MWKLRASWTRDDEAPEVEEERMRREEGFTLIELLIVVVIIGVLAAIAIPQFTNTKQKAFDAAAQSDIRNLMTAEEAYFFGRQAYGASTVTAGGTADLDGDGNSDFQASMNVSLTATAYTDGYRITAKHASSNQTWCVNSSPSNAAGAIGQIVQGTGC
ncbi:type IV pilin protein [Candidatus Palauibacter sp.]|uniref:type IV pilin protein n=1 Tax=Candidatus Palauibacter sp. TaxID=3101350 RepID=UPI003CC6449E